MENKDLLGKLSDFDTLILVKIKKSDDILFAPFEYLTGSFKSVGIKDFHNFNELISSIYKSATICEGIGYYEFCNQVKESIYYCQSQGIRHSFILPLSYNDETYYFYYFNDNKKAVNNFLAGLKHYGYPFQSHKLNMSM